MSAEHGSSTMLRRYVLGDALSTDQVWALEVHLESCARCRAAVADIVAGQRPRFGQVIDEVWSTLDTTGVPGARRSRWRRCTLALATWASPAMTPWLGMTLVVLALAWLADLAGQPLAPGLSLLTLFAPIAPLLGIAAAWGRSLDPVHELVAATPLAGLNLVLRRTVAVLVAVVPLLLLANWATGTTSALWLLPCLGFTVATLGIGSLIGLLRTAMILIGLWTALVVLPSLATDQLSIALQAASVPGWLAVVAAGTVLLTLKGKRWFAW
ncbi:MAG TPA: zf-HC2 domain-containing protein [Pseudonocardiaceae bacterium]